MTTLYLPSSSYNKLKAAEICFNKVKQRVKELRRFQKIDVKAYCYFKSIILDTRSALLYFFVCFNKNDQELNQLYKTLVDEYISQDLDVDLFLEREFCSVNIYFPPLTEVFNVSQYMINRFTDMAEVSAHMKDVYIDGYLSLDVRNPDILAVLLHTFSGDKLDVIRNFEEQSLKPLAKLETSSVGIFANEATQWKMKSLSSIFLPGYDKEPLKMVKSFNAKESTTSSSEHRDPLLTQSKTREMGETQATSSIAITKTALPLAVHNNDALHSHAQNKSSSQSDCSQRKSITLPASAKLESASTDTAIIESGNVSAREEIEVRNPDLTVFNDSAIINQESGTISENVGRMATVKIEEANEGCSDRKINKPVKPKLFERVKLEQKKKIKNKLDDETEVELQTEIAFHLKHMNKIKEVMKSKSRGGFLSNVQSFFQNPTQTEEDIMRCAKLFCAKRLEEEKNKVRLDHGKSLLNYHVLVTNRIPLKEAKQLCYLDSLHNTENLAQAEHCFFMELNLEYHSRIKKRPVEEHRKVYQETHMHI